MRPALTPESVARTRARLTSIATELFVSEGVEALSLRKLAAAAGMSRSTPYGYFETKQEIIDSVRAQGFDRMTARCAEALARAREPLTQMRELGRTVVQFALAEPKIYQLMFSGPVFTANVPPILAEAVRRFRAVSRPPLENAIRLGLVEGDADALRRATWAAFHGLITLGLHGHLDGAELEADFERLNHMIGYGILTPKARQEGLETPRKEGDARAPNHTPDDRA